MIISHLTPHSHGLFVMVFNRNRLIPASIQKMILHKVFASSPISTLVIAGDMCISVYIYNIHTVHMFWGSDEGNKLQDLPIS